MFPSGSSLKPFFPSLPHLSRFYRVLVNSAPPLAHLAIRMAQGKGLLQVVDLKPIPLAHGHRIRGFDLSVFPSRSRVHNLIRSRLLLKMAGVEL
ncbi:hypothetical protein THFILI_11835 [Thermus filiformis]|uniref:Uncharacterized protein n=1 Tax=Thermus filiformis TaxID=276 RepID=A0A0A2WM63_THEFI|nr:hypothetical protein THFILI_11835 [Thermus filiformis]